MRTIITALFPILFITSVFVSTVNASAYNGYSYKYACSNEPASYPSTSAFIKYISLTASTNGKSVFVDWVTAAEENNSHFEVERSLDLKTFKTVALVLDGFANNGKGKTYKFKETAGYLGKAKKVYYRLKQIDRDGKVSYSAVLTVDFSVTDNSNLNKQTNL